MRRSYEKHRRHKNRGAKRAWRLKRMAIEENVEEVQHITAAAARKRDKGGDRVAEDMERFMQVLRLMPCVAPVVCACAACVEQAICSIVA